MYRIYSLKKNSPPRNFPATPLYKGISGAIRQWQIKQKRTFPYRDGMVKRRNKGTIESSCRYRNDREPSMAGTGRLSANIYMFSINNDGIRKNIPLPMINLGNHPAHYNNQTQTPESGVTVI